MTNPYRNSFYLLTSLYVGPSHCFSRLANTSIKRNIRADLLPGGLAQFAFFIAYGLVSIPAGRLLQRIGYQSGIIVGLAVMGIGCLFFCQLLRCAGMGCSSGLHLGSG